MVLHEMRREIAAGGASSRSARHLHAPFTEIMELVTEVLPTGVVFEDFGGFPWPVGEVCVDRHRFGAVQEGCREGRVRPEKVPSADGSIEGPVFCVHLRNTIAESLRVAEETGECRYLVSFFRRDKVRLARAGCRDDSKKVYAKCAFRLSYAKVHLTQRCLGPSLALVTVSRQANCHLELSTDITYQKHLGHIVPSHRALLEPQKLCCRSSRTWGRFATMS